MIPYPPVRPPLAADRSSAPDATTALVSVSGEPPASTPAVSASKCDSPDTESTMRTQLVVPAGLAGDAVISVTVCTVVEASPVTRISYSTPPVVSR